MTVHQDYQMNRKDKYHPITKHLNIKILDLVLIGKWYDLIESGIKREEYREIKPYWKKRLSNNRYTHVKFRRGYTKQSMLFEITDISIGKGNVDLGAPADKDIFIIKFR